MADFEKLGAFYLGRVYDVESDAVTDEPVLYDAKDLTTHAVCVGMTGSGKTGLGVALLEEAILDGVPVIAIDPKGDLANLLLTFPRLEPADFEPWVDPSEAARKGRTVAEQARHTADLWRKGLADWGQDAGRIGKFADAAEARVYTPGSSAGHPLTVLRSFEAPGPALLADADALRDRIESAVSGLLGLVGVEADPVRSREHILLASILERAWREGRGLDLAGIIRAVQSPPFERAGVFDLESFYPAADRFELAMSLNNVIASPGFSAWTEGEPLEVGRLLYAADGKPRLSVISIAHLSESERMFFVTLLLGEVLAWVRSQPGSRSLRALLYMDEVFGYFPPTANPPSKKPMLTLLKQARAYGLGVVLATQNPVDLDYKGLSNAGTWFLGRLQTERDKARVIEGLEGASAAAGAGFDRARTERILAGLDSRVFLMNNVHEDEPVVFHTRWVLSYLAGPMTREQIRTLCGARGGSGGRARSGAATVEAERESLPAAEKKGAPGAQRPVVPPGIDEGFLAVTRPLPADARLHYRPRLLGVATLHYSRSSLSVEEWRKTALLARFGDGERSPWESARMLPTAAVELVDEPEPGAGFASLPGAAARAKTYKSWDKMLRSHLYASRRLTVLRCRELKTWSKAGEPEGEFRGRLRDLLREKRDLALEKLRKRYASKLERLRDRIRTAEARVEREQEQYKSQKLQTAISLGSTVLGALFGRKLGSSSTVGGAATTARGAGRAARERGDIERAVESLDTLRAKLADLEEEFEAEVEAVRDDLVVDNLECEEVALAPRKSDLSVERLALVWTPWAVDAEGVAEPLFFQE